MHKLYISLNSPNGIVENQDGEIFIDYSELKNLTQKKETKQIKKSEELGIKE